MRTDKTYRIDNQALRSTQPFVPST